MNARACFGFLVGGLIVAGLLVGRSGGLTRQAEAQQLSPYPVQGSPVLSQQVAPVPQSVDVGYPVPVATQDLEPITSPPTANPRVYKFKTTVSPTYEGGALGQEIPVTVEVRVTGLKDCTPAMIQKNLPEKVKIGLAQALSNAANAGGSGDEKLGQILERLDRIEKQLQKLESEKATLPPPVISSNVGSTY